MIDVSQVNRPLSLRELAIGYGLSPEQLEILTARHRIEPAFKLEGIAAYGGKQIKAIERAMKAESKFCPV